MTTSQCFPSAEITTFSCLRGQGACKNYRKFILHLKYQMFPMLSKKLVLSNDAFLIAVMLFSNGFNANKGLYTSLLIPKVLLSKDSPTVLCRPGYSGWGSGGFA